MNKLKKIIIILFSCLIFSCGSSSTETETVVIGVSYNIRNLDPLYSINSTESNISSILYLSLVRHRWDYRNKKLVFSNELAESVSWNKDSTKALIKLGEFYWEDGSPVTTEDIAVSLIKYSDRKLSSKFVSDFGNYYHKEGKIDSLRTFAIFDMKNMSIMLKNKGSWFDLDFPIAKKETLTGIKVEEIISGKKKIKIVSNSPYKISSDSDKNYLILKLVKSHPLAREHSPKKIVFKFIPSYTARISELKKESIDICEDLLPDDIEINEIKDNYRIESVIGRELLLVGLNNSIAPLSSKKFRMWINSIIDKEEILNQVYLKRGKIAESIISPLFQKDSVKLKKNIISLKNNVQKMNMIIPFGDSKRELITEKIKNSFAANRVVLEVEKLEPSVFGQRIMSKDFEMALMIFGIPIPPEMELFWHSNKKIGTMNLWSYSNPELDSLLDSQIPEWEKIERVNKIIMDDMPVVPLIWPESFIAVNKRIKNFSASPVGFLNECWKWEIE